MHNPRNHEHTATALRVMHACEQGAIGVYRGHKCAARYFFRNSLPQLDEMRLHEGKHLQIFAALLAERGLRTCYGFRLWFFGGLIYGALVGLLGRRAVGVSTATIERIVDAELELAHRQFSGETALGQVLREVQEDERQHQQMGEALAENAQLLAVWVTRLARFGAYTAKNISARL
jgi:demethoxyubiquinone hydroxylase (CLK1/Coq7/Cat5 family)